MSDKITEKDLVPVTEMINQLTESSMSDTMGLHMQNSVTNQQSMQTVSNAATSTACALILKQGG
ncbi:RebB family R body protein [Vibrio mexicanus]|uniref:RebB family R body protein n=1 Tax=Vibrio mexicanus TaxID=1004326 RepID=UPI00063C4F8A|nr:RebB family R body protein [Vibrio mexicanus]